MIILHILYESFSQAKSQLLGNKLRSFLSLLGITIGIFCIIAVRSSVDSLEDNIRGSFDKLGNDVYYIEKRPWGPGGMEWWKYERRPMPTYDDFLAVNERVQNAKLKAYSVFLGSKTVKYKSNSVSGGLVIAITDDYPYLFSIDLHEGRFFSPLEFSKGNDVIVIGYEIAENLFGNENPIGKSIRLNGRKMKISGVIAKSGKSLINPVNFDNCYLIPYNTARKTSDLKSRTFWTSITVKAKSSEHFEKLKDEVTSVLRAERKLKPREGNTFSINELSIVKNALDGFFRVLNIAGIIIGGFAILVGIFSVANIMFVTVKERTNIIGIKKAIGAKSYAILLEILVESGILCLIGGLLGLAIVWVTMKILSNALDFHMYLSLSNIIWGSIVSIIIGIIAGLIPAYQAAKMDPVEAMRK
jgi:putative ABC transport system permease protein